MAQNLGPRSGHVYQELRADIEAGLFAVGSPLPSQTELARRYGIAVMTVRQAIERLALEGFVNVRVGSGTYVAATIPSDTGLASLLRSVITAAPLPIISLDRNGNVTGWNPAAERIFGWTETEVLERLPPFVSEEQAEQHQTFVQETLAGRPLHDIEVVRRRRDGSDVTLSLSTAAITNASGQIRGIVFTYLDLTERKAAEELLHRSEVQLRTLIESAPVGICITNRHGIVEEVNSSFARMLGYHPSELVGSHHRTLIAPEQRDRVSRLRTERFAQPVEALDEFAVLHKDGSRVTVLSTGVALDRPDGEPWRAVFVIDITERQMIEAGREASERRFRTLVEKAPIGVCVTSAAGIFEQVNAAYAAMLGYQPHELVGHHYTTVLPTDESARLASMRPNELFVGYERLAELEFSHREGGRVTVLTSTISMEGSDAIQNATFALDISERKRVEEMLHHQATHDGLTGLATRLVLVDRLRNALVHAKRQGEIVGVLSIGLEGLQEVNDRHGHEAGDAVLAAAAKRLNACARPSDTIARLAGAVFVMLLPDIGSAAHAAGVAEKIIDGTRAPFHLGDLNFTLSVSIGIGVYPFGGEEIEELLQAADEAMYRARRLGQNTYALHNFDTAG